MRTDLELLGHTYAHAVSGFQSLFARGAVGIACVHNQRPHQTLSTAQVLASNGYWRGNNLIARKHGGGGSAVRSQGQC